jgi:predicted extracellular nuclease
VTEFDSGDASRPITELTFISELTVLRKNVVVAATSISLPSTDTFYLERYEGMLVKFATALTVGQNYFLGRFGQLTLAYGRLEKPTNRYTPGSAEANSATAANARNIILLDDNNFVQNPNPIPYIGANNTVRAGDTVLDLTGVIDFGSFTAFNGPAGYKLQPSIAPEFQRRYDIFMISCYF